MRYLGGAVGHQQSRAAGATPPLAQTTVGEDDEWVDVPDANEAAHDDPDRDSDAEDEPEGGYVPSEDEEEDEEEEGRGTEHDNDVDDEDPDIGPEDGEDEDMVDNEFEIVDAAPL